MPDNEHMPMRPGQQAFPTILVVASDLKMLKLLEMALKTELACEVFSITRGRSAIETARHVTPDLVIIDAHLLDLNALELSDQLHSSKNLESIPTILINIRAASLSRPQRGHTILLRGPFVLVDFYAALNRCLGRT
jgi:PleD family two-component response regulator